MTFQCVLVTPEQQLVDETITQAILPAHDGKVGILTDRAPIVMRLGTGTLRLDTVTGQKKFLHVEGGAAEMKDNKLTIISTTARPSTETA